MIPLLSLADADLAGLARAHGQPAFRAGQLRAWLHARRVDTLDAMTDLPSAWRRTLARTHAARTLAETARRAAPDGLTGKFRLEAPDGAAFEAVLIRERRGRRRTACVSCMAGCPLGCVFCATGRGGYTRALAAHEILEQAYRADADARRTPPAPTAAPSDDDAFDDDADDGGDDGEGLTHVVFMGMGEPLLNLDAVLAAAARMTAADGLGLGGRRVTISTVGIPAGLRRLAESGANHRLAWSLHAPDQALRAALMPAARTWPLADVLPALERYAATASRLVTVEYALIAGVNDGVARARAVAALVRSWRGRVNLIPYNPVDGYGGRAPTVEAVHDFRRCLEDAGVAVTVRTEKGASIGAACGQLAAERPTRP